MTEQKNALTRQQLAIEMALDVLQNDFDGAYRVLMKETATSHDQGILDSLSLIELALDELVRMRERRHMTLDDCMGDITRIGAISNAINRACGDQEGAVGCYARSSATYAAVLLHMIEVAEDEPGGEPDAD